jgi:hypothetical protein
MSDLDAIKWKEYLEAKKALDNSIPKEILEKMTKEEEKKAKHRKVCLENYYRRIREDGPAFVEQVRQRSKELYHLRKEKKKREKEEAMRLEELRAERARGCGNPFGKGVEGLKLEDSESEAESIPDAYCSTCPTDNESVVSMCKPTKKPLPEIKPPSPPPIVQHYFSSFNFI